MTSLAWHRADLRTHDHAALAEAASAGPVLGVVVLDPTILNGTSARRRALFYAAVTVLRASYERLGGMLVVRQGDPAQVLPALAQQTGAVQLHALLSHTPYGAVRDGAAAAALEAAGVRVRWHEGVHVHEPGTLLTQQGGAYSVYTPYARQWLGRESETVDAPARLAAPDLPEAFDVGAVPVEESDVALPEAGEAAALRRLDAFIEERLAGYADRRSTLDGAGGSRLSIDFTLGTLSARLARERISARGEGPRKWLGELAWRDFLADALWHRPQMIDEPFDTKWRSFPWTDDNAGFEAWRDGRTGIPVVDAAMRELRQTGWISNRARMVAAQFLCKHPASATRRGAEGLLQPGTGTAPSGSRTRTRRSATRWRSRSRRCGWSGSAAASTTGASTRRSPTASCPAPAWRSASPSRSWTAARGAAARGWPGSSSPRSTT
jgi:deoxyribodipyrimidine photo-lyase